jgi:hypothetical protein
MDLPEILHLAVQPAIHVALWFNGGDNIIVASPSEQFSPFHFLQSRNGALQ